MMNNERINTINTLDPLALYSADQQAPIMNQLDIK